MVVEQPSRGVAEPDKRAALRRFRNQAAMDAGRRFRIARSDAKTARSCSRCSGRSAGAASTVRRADSMAAGPRSRSASARVMPTAP